MQSVHLVLALAHGHAVASLLTWVSLVVRHVPLDVGLNLRFLDQVWLHWSVIAVCFAVIYRNISIT